MNLRISVIILAASLFMAIWNADQRAIQKQVVAARNRSHSLKVASTSGVLTETARPLITARSTTPVPEEQAPLPASSAVIPLPANLAAGTWTAVSDNGQRTVITVHQAPAAGQSEEHFCIVNGEAGRRWCFVRSSVKIDNGQNH
ncbi:MAG: hypothetical protein RL215_256 [Planctomycetota bacterium]|jgi:hypothetical protein